MTNTSFHLSGCQKLTHVHHDVGADQAVVYLKLRSSGCDRHPALKFTSRSVCRTRSPAIITGPSCCRVLKPKPLNNLTKLYNPNQLGTFHLGPGFSISPNEVICSASNTLGDMLSAGEDKASEDFLKRIGRVSAFYEESSNKHDLSTTSQSKLFARIHELQKKAQALRQEPRKYLQTDENQFFELVDDFEQSKNFSSTVLKQLKVFPNILPESQTKIEVKPPQELFRSRQGYEEFTKVQRETEAITRNAAIEQFVRDGQYVMNITGTQDLTELRNKRNKHRQFHNIISSLTPQKASLALEFNQSQYVVSDKPPNQTGLKRTTINISSFTKLPSPPPTINKASSPSKQRDYPKSLNCIMANFGVNKANKIIQENQEKVNDSNLIQNEWTEFETKLNGLVSAELKKTSYPMQQHTKIDESNFHEMRNKYEAVKQRRMKHTSSNISLHLKSSTTSLQPSPIHRNILETPNNFTSCTSTMLGFYVPHQTKNYTSFKKISDRSKARITSNTIYSRSNSPLSLSTSILPFQPDASASLF